MGLPTLILGLHYGIFPKETPTAYVTWSLLKMCYYYFSDYTNYTNTITFSSSDLYKKDLKAFLVFHIKDS